MPKRQPARPAFVHCPGGTKAYLSQGMMVVTARTEIWVPCVGAQGHEGPCLMVDPNDATKTLYVPS